MLACFFVVRYRVFLGDSKVSIWFSKVVKYDYCILDFINSIQCMIIMFVFINCKILC